MSEQQQVLDLMERLRDSLHGPVDKTTMEDDTQQLEVPHFPGEEPASSDVRAPHVPEVGIYEGIPEADYLAWDAASSSRLSKLLQTPAHMRAGMRGELEETAAQAEGHALHCAVLEPDSFASRFVVAEQCAAKIKSGERKGQQCQNAGLMLHKKEGWLCGTHLKGVDKSQCETLETKAITEGVRRMCLNVRDAVYRNRTARGLLTCEGVNEITVVHEHATDDEGLAPVRVKTRRDRDAYGLGAIVDLKKTTDASKRAFRKRIFEYGYHRQGELYLQAADAHGDPRRHFVIIAAESDPPYGVGVYRLLDDVLEAARRQLDPLLRLYALVRERNLYPAYPEKVQDIGLAPWAWDAMEQEIDHVEAMYQNLRQRR